MAKVRIIDLDIVAGDGWSMRFEYHFPPDNLGVSAPAIPALWVARIQFRSHPNQATPLVELNPTVDYDLGEFTATMTSEQSRTLPGLGVWAAGIESPDGHDGQEFCRGKVTVWPEGVLSEQPMRLTLTEDVVAVVRLTAPTMPVVAVSAPAGPRGPAGPQGPPGLDGFVVSTTPPADTSVVWIKPV